MLFSTELYSVFFSRKDDDTYGFLSNVTKSCVYC